MSSSASRSWPLTIACRASARATLASLASPAPGAGAAVELADAVLAVLALDRGGGWSGPTTSSWSSPATSTRPARFGGDRGDLGGAEPTGSWFKPATGPGYRAKCA